MGSKRIRKMGAAGNFGLADQLVGGGSLCQLDLERPVGCVLQYKSSGGSCRVMELAIKHLELQLTVPPPPHTHTPSGPHTHSLPFTSLSGLCCAYACAC